MGYQQERSDRTQRIEICGWMDGQNETADRPGAECCIRLQQEYADAIPAKKGTQGSSTVLQLLAEAGGSAQPSPAHQLWNFN
jgi:hypothetical protein